jgi:hypothetical protein
MPTRLRNTDILFNDSTTQSTAAPKLVRINTFLTSRTYTVPSGVTALMIFAVGASGGSVAEINPSTGVANLGGQGGCGYAEKYITTPAASYVITIGAGGVGATAGGTTTIDTISITSSAALTSGTGSAGGVASGGTFNANGGAGGNVSGVNPPDPRLGQAGGGSGAGGSRAGAGFAGGNGSTYGVLNVSWGGGGGGGGSGGAGATSTDNIGGAGGVAATTASASAVTVGQYFTPAGAAGIFPAGSPGQSVAGNVTGVGGIGAPGSAYPASMYYTAGAFDVQMIRARAGRVNERAQETASGGFPGAVQIWEFF